MEGASLHLPPRNDLFVFGHNWERVPESNQRSSTYEDDEMTDFSNPRYRMGKEWKGKETLFSPITYIVYHNFVIFSNFYEEKFRP